MCVYVYVYVLCVVMIKIDDYGVLIIIDIKSNKGVDESTDNIYDEEL